MSFSDSDGWSLAERRAHGKKPQSDTLTSSAGLATAVSQETDLPETLSKSAAGRDTGELLEKIEHISFKRSLWKLHSPPYGPPRVYTLYKSGETTSPIYDTYNSIPPRELLPYLKENSKVQSAFMRYYKDGRLKEFERMPQSQRMDEMPDVPGHLQETEEKMDFRFFSADGFEVQKSASSSGWNSMQRRFTYQWKERSLTQEGRTEYKGKDSFFTHRAVTNKTMAVFLAVGPIRYTEFKDFSSDNQRVYGFKAGKEGEIIQYNQDQALFFTADTTYEQLLDVLGAPEDLH